MKVVRRDGVVRVRDGGVHGRQLTVGQVGVVPLQGWEVRAVDGVRYNHAQYAPHRHICNQIQYPLLTMQTLCIQY